MGIGGTEGTAAGRPTGLDDDGPAPAAVLVAGLTGFFAAVAALAGGAAGFLDGALFSFAAGPCAVAETFFAAGTAFAAGAFFVAGLVAGVAFAAGFFTVTGSLNELERAFTGCLLPWEPLRLSDRAGSTLSGCSRLANPGVIPPKAHQKRAAPRAGSHILSIGTDMAAGTGARLYRELERAGALWPCRSTPLASRGVVGGGNAGPPMPLCGAGPSDHSTKESKS
jgi:hypothetical protein